MSGSPTVEDLVAGLGPAWDEVRAIAVAVPGASWAVLLKGELVIGVQHEAEEGRVVLSGEPGLIEDRHRLKVYESMLAFNALARELGGMRLSLAGLKREPQLTAEIAAEGLTGDGLRLAIATIAGATRRWAEYIADPAASRPPPFLGIRG